MKTFDLLSVRFFAEHLGRPDRMHGPDGSERQTQEEPQHVAFGLGKSEPNAAVDRGQKHQDGGNAFGHGLLQSGSFEFGPDRLEVGEHFLPGHLPLRLALDSDSKLCVDGLAVGRVLEVEAGGAALLGEGVAVLDAQGKEVCFEVHEDQSKPCS